ncbi:GGDEF domain-containing protein [Congregibacter litoralis]|uniref:diguanylate cyclase n=1 Tax=Congregibacter litoralis KT71 TaxID=314285 RepID=A4A8T9_9GAMM|nr:GGDEF domain-containing protein [Congregibacter litoralis]EAQ97481.2 diguanylate cyclase (GGDEF) domain protein [Congregibacter litoralis KT71]
MPPLSPANWRSKVARDHRPSYIASTAKTNESTLISSDPDPISISPERMAAAYRDDARRIVGIAVPFFTGGFLLEAASHAGDADTRMFLQPLLSAVVCVIALVFSRRYLTRIRFPELILLVLWWLVLWSLYLHELSFDEPVQAPTLVMLAVTTVGSAMLIMPTVAAVLAIGTTASLYVYGQISLLGLEGLSSLVTPVIVVMVVLLIYRSRRSSIRNVEELRERVARDQRELEVVNQQLLSLSITDPLTGALNRRGFNDRLKAELAGAARTGTPLSVLMLDVDHFKHYNDAFGHPAGDVALRKTSEALRACCRDNDSVSRYGGEEFALILPATDAEGAGIMAERVRQAVAKLEGLKQEITVSVGAASAPAAVLTDLAMVATTLVAFADSALYRAKEGGRDRAEINVLTEMPAES